MLSSARLLPSCFCGATLSAIDNVLFREGRGWAETVPYMREAPWNVADNGLTWRVQERLVSSTLKNFRGGYIVFAMLRISKNELWIWEKANGSDIMNTRKGTYKGKAQQILIIESLNCIDTHNLSQLEQEGDADMTNVAISLHILAPAVSPSPTPFLIWQTAVVNAFDWVRGTKTSQWLWC